MIHFGRPFEQAEGKKGDQGDNEPDREVFVEVFQSDAPFSISVTNSIRLPVHRFHWMCGQVYREFNVEMGATTDLKKKKAWGKMILNGNV